MAGRTEVAAPEDGVVTRHHRGGDRLLRHRREGNHVIVRAIHKHLGQAAFKFAFVGEERNPMRDDSAVDPRFLIDDHILDFMAEIATITYNALPTQKPKKKKK